jgi:tetratricopeptide (TPR) repeat protein
VSAARALACVVAVAIAARAARADEVDPDPGDARFRAATARQLAGDLAGAATDFEALATELPGSAWADDALVEAARLADRLGDLPRARRAAEAAIAIVPGSRAARWARGFVAELDARTGDGRWSEVAAAEKALVAAVGRHGDPDPHLDRLEALLVASPGYPRAAQARIWLGDRWAQQGEWPHALALYTDAIAAATEPAVGRRATARRIEALAALDRHAEAARALGAFAADPAADPAAVRRVSALVDTQRDRHRLRIAAWIALGVLVVAGLAVLARTSGSARAALRALLRPPVEVLFAVPVVAVVIAVSATSNDLVGRAIAWIGVGGLAIAWLSGTTLATAARRAPLRAPRVAAHVAATVLAVLALVYLSIVDDRLIDMVLETWAHGPD